MLFSHHDWQTLSLIALLALILNLFFGTLVGFRFHRLSWSPRNLWKFLLLKAEHKMNRKKRDARTRKRRGTLITLLSCAISLFSGAALAILFSFPQTTMLEILLLGLCLQTGQALRLSIKTSKVAKAKNAWDKTVTPPLPTFLLRRKLATYDNSTLIRATVEYLALSLNYGTMAPITLYLLLGWPGLILLINIRIMDQLFGYKSKQLKDYGSSCAFIHQLLNLIPARVTAVLIASATVFSPKGNPLRAFSLMIKQGSSQLNSLNNGWPLAAVAGGFSFSLGGPRRIRNHTISDNWIGNGTSQLKIADLTRMRWCYAIAVLLTILLLCAIAGKNTISTFTNTIPAYYQLGLKL